MNRRSLLKKLVSIPVWFGSSARSLFALAVSSFSINRDYHSYKWPYLSKSVDKLRKNEGKYFYKSVIIGSGYGASVAALRSAEILQPMPGELCLLERGAEWQPQDYPDKFDIFENSSEAEKASILAHKFRQLKKYALNNIRTYLSHSRIQLNPLGLLEINSSGDVDVLNGNALGGGSNINANVVIRPKANVFEKEVWNHLNISYTSLEPYFERVENELDIESYPEPIEFINQSVSSDLPPLRRSFGLYEFSKSIIGKSDILINANFDISTSVKFKSMPLAVNLTRLDGEFNKAGVKQFRCSLCGDCVSGCKTGAKGTLQMNYLAQASNKGCEIYTKTEVDYIEEVPGGYRIHLLHHDYSPNEAVWYKLNKLYNKLFPKKYWIQTHSLYLGAGSLGSTRILFKSIKKGNLKLSKLLGKKFTANGDQFGVSYNGEYKAPSSLFNSTDKSIDGLGFGLKNEYEAGANQSSPPIGPTITSALEFHSEKDTVLIEDAVIPAFAVSRLRQILSGLFKLDKKLSKAQKARIEIDLSTNDVYRGALNHSATYVCMSHDSSDGEMSPHSYNGDLLKISFSKKPSQQKGVQQINYVLRRIAGFFKGVYIENPRTSSINDILVGSKGGVATTVHPLGGMPMGMDIESGVVDNLGRIFRDGGSNSNDVYSGLYGVCGAIIPSSLGANPLLTIAANAERIMDHHSRGELQDSIYKNAQRI